MKKKKLIMKLISDLYAAKELLDAAYDEISILEKALDMQREAAKVQTKQELREALTKMPGVPVDEIPLAG